MHASGLRIAAVPGTRVSIITVERIGALACSIKAITGGGAGIIVITGGAVVGMDAAGSGVAAVVSAEIAVITVWRRTADTNTAGAGVGSSAGIAVIAGSGIVGMDAAGRGVAAVGGADVSVIAIEGGAADTDSAGAGVGSGTGIAVIAGGGVVGMETAGSGVAAVSGAEIAVITVYRGSDTYPTDVGVGGGAGITVITGTTRYVLRNIGCNLVRPLAFIKGGVKCRHDYIISCALVQIGKCIPGNFSWRRGSRVISR